MVQYSRTSPVRNNMSLRRDFAESVLSARNVNPVVGISDMEYADYAAAYCTDMGGRSSALYMCNPNGCHVSNAGELLIISLRI